MYTSGNITVNNSEYYTYSTSSNFTFNYSNGSWGSPRRVNKPRNNQEAKKFLDSERGW